MQSQLQQAQCAFGNLRSQLEHDKDHVTFAEKVTQQWKNINLITQKEASFRLENLTHILSQLECKNAIGKSDQALLRIQHEV